MVRRIVFSLSFLFALPALASTYYIDCNAGSDSNAGTSITAAWRTVGKVNSISFAAGDKILFNKGCTWTDNYLHITAVGTSASPVTFSSYGTGAQPTISGASTLLYALYIQGAKYAVVDNLHFTLASLQNVIVGNANTDHVTIQNCLIDHAGKSGIFLYGSAPAGQTPLWTTGNITIKNNNIHLNGSTADDHGIYIDNSSNNLLESNIWDSNIGYGVQIQDSSDNNVVRYNQFHANGFGDPQHTWGGAFTIYNWETSRYHMPTGNQIYGNVSNGDRYGMLAGGSSSAGSNAVSNNTFYGNQYGVVVHDGANFGTFQNNIVWGSSSSYALYVSGSFKSDYNIVGPAHSGYIYWNAGYSTLASYSGATGNDTHSKEADPLFVSPSTVDFTLQSNSPAIDKGVNLGTSYQMELNPSGTFPWTTANENSYGSGWEMGAFVYVGGGGGAPDPPTGLTAIVQ